MIKNFYYLIFSILFLNACQEDAPPKGEKKVEVFNLNDSLSIEYHFNKGQLILIKNIVNQKEVVQLISFYHNGKLKEFNLAERPLGNPMRPYEGDSSIMEYVYQFQYLSLDSSGNTKNAQISHDFEQVYSGYWK
jgi:hypothetical protein